MDTIGSHPTSIRSRGPLYPYPSACSPLQGCPLSFLEYIL